LQDGKAYQPDGAGATRQSLQDRHSTIAAGLGRLAPSGIDAFHLKLRKLSMNPVNSLFQRMRDEELTLLQKLRLARRERRVCDPAQLTLGDRISDAVAATVGSWSFIIIQSIILVLWMALNISAYVQQWDPYPFILLNLVLSFQAAYAAPFIMMSQNRQAAIDRAEAKNDYTINIKAELEIELLHQKIDLLRETEVLELIRLIRSLEDRLAAALAPPGSLAPSLPGAPAQPA
jgi:uncharacterized membrane protein